MDPKRRHEHGDELAARVRALSERLRSADLVASTVPPPGPEVMEAMQLRREGLLIAEETLDDAEPSRVTAPTVARRSLFELCPAAAFVTDGQGVVVEANPAAVELFAPATGTLTGRSLAGFVERVDVGRFRLALAALGREGSLAVEVRLLGRGGVGVATTLAADRRADDRYAWTARATPLESGIRPQPALPRSLVVEHLDALHEALADAERSRDEATARVRELEAALAAREHALAVLAHELRQPLSSVAGWARVLQHPRVDAAQRARAVRAIAHAAEHQRALVDDLIDASRASAERLHVERAPVDLAALAHLSVDVAQPDARSAAVSLTCHSRGACAVLGDARRLAQVLSNLIGNALKFTPPGGAVAVRVTAGEGVATLRVADTGAGIEAAEIPRVFERFHQAAEGEGLGLGLYLVREIVDRHGGEVSAASPGPGLGATFTVALPLAP